jgi:hypothetical protein
VFFSFYEVYITSLRALTAMGFPYGVDEDAAFMTTWLELHKLEGIQKLAELSNQLDQQFSGKIDLDSIKYNNSIDLLQTSLLMKGPGLFDYFFEETKKNYYFEVTLENCIDPIFIIPLAERLSKKLESINASWLDDKKKKVGISVSKNRILIGDIEDSVEILDGQVLLQFSIDGRDKSSENRKLNIKNIKLEINDAVEQDHLEKSLKPHSRHWDILLEYAHKTFVPASDESRIRGAGGGNDND